MTTTTDLRPSMTKTIIIKCSDKNMKTVIITKQYDNNNNHNDGNNMMTITTIAIIINTMTITKQYL